MSPERAVPIACAICDVLDHVHTEGVVHRDLSRKTS
jgi:serine/threonine protein kinase